MVFENISDAFYLVARVTGYLSLALVRRHASVKLLEGAISTLDEARTKLKYAEDELRSRVVGGSF